MSPQLIFIFSLSVGLPLLSLLFKKEFCVSSLPFLLIYFLLGLCNECLYYYLPFDKVGNIITNVFFLFEFFLIHRQLKQWGVFQRKFSFGVMLSAGLIVYLLTLFYYDSFKSLNSLFLVFSNFTLVLACIDAVSHFYVADEVPLTKDYRFIIVSCLIIFFCLSILVESFFIFKLNLSPTFMNRVFEIKVYLNVLIHIIILSAILWTPTKKISTSRS